MALYVMIIVQAVSKLTAYVVYYNMLIFILFMASSRRYCLVCGPTMPNGWSPDPSPKALGSWGRGVGYVNLASPSSVVQDQSSK